ncbi:sirohydrochlorin chelatase [Neobacillus sp. SM06]|uniref:sirohydrochlorin chelatase n=1 Tax=Neobacillus sp. SM06 TaxID=3422492 RepID=UPI003D28F576
MKAILYIGHGTKAKKGAEEAKAFMQQVMEKVKAPIQEMSFLEFTEPSIEQGFFRCVEKGAAEITVVPLFLLAAGHIKRDIPRIITSLKKKHPAIKVDIRNPFGVQSEILDGVVELVRNTVVDVNKDDSILIVGTGGSDPTIYSAYDQIVEGIRKRLGTEHVSACFLAAAKPDLEQGLEMISQQTDGRVIVVPYLLFSGVLLNVIIQKIKKRKNQEQDIVYTGSLGSHRIVQELVIQQALNLDNQIPPS